MLPGCAVPGAPVSAGSAIQKSVVIPHCPQISQHAFKGQGLRFARSDILAGAVVLGTCGPQTALAMGAGIGGVPVLKQITWPTYRLQPDQPHTSVFLDSSYAVVMEYVVAIAEHMSLAWTIYSTQLPSAFGCGEKSGNEPAEQHIY